MLAVVVLLPLIAQVKLPYSTMVAITLTSPKSAGVQFLGFTLLLVGSVLIARLLFDASLWTLLFCCSAGYAIQNLASGLAELVWIFVKHSSYLSDYLRQQPASPYQVVQWISFAVIMLAVGSLVRQSLRGRELEALHDSHTLIILVSVILMIIGFDLVIKSLCSIPIAFGYAVALRLVRALICIFVLWMGYEMLVNRTLREEQALSAHLLAEREHITMSVVADGHALDFMAEADIYALFGNILENAVEASLKISDPELRSIALVIKKTCGVVSIHQENYCSETIVFKDGLPQTSKANANAHGLGGPHGIKKCR